ncbi:serine protease 38-like [Cimex lectularius]|uniref:Peptidase S1 domain-containing protein n=1 Tax=Cimex lectularius TaxID=79782 RepID=A0A8I6RJ56_CIMLE|nr:serine protease 38-like [Cimex lectularius]
MSEVHMYENRQQSSSTLLVKLLFILLIGDRYLLASSEEGGKIIGGRKARKGEFPSTVCYDGNARCGGTLVTLDKVISAGHCFNIDGTLVDASQVIIIAGVVNLNDKSGSKQESVVKEYKIHEKFERRQLRFGGHYVLYDIALAILKNPFVPSDTVKPVSFPASDPAGMQKFVQKLRTSNEICFATGYGVVAMQGKDRVVSDDLKVAEVRLLPQIECRLLSEMADFEICGSAVRGNEQTAPGDSGSTFLCSGSFIGLTKGSKSFDLNGKQITLLIFTLVGPSMDYFGLTGSVQGGGGSSTLQLHPVIFLSLLITSIYVSWN